VLAKSEGRQAKEIAIRRKKLARLLRKLRAMRRSCPKRDQLLMRVGAAKTDVGRAFGFVKINLPGPGQAVTRETFTFQLDKAKLKEAELRDGHYLLRTNLVAEDPAVLWDRYMQLTQIEAAFKCLKSDLGIRPIYHQREHRVEAHILVLPGLLSDCDVEAPASGVCSRTHTPRGAGKIGGDSNVGCLVSNHGRPPARDASVYRAGTGAGPAAPPPQAGTPGSAASANHGRDSEFIGPPPIEHVVETFGVPLLKTKAFPVSHVPNCESRDNATVVWLPLSPAGLSDQPPGRVNETTLRSKVTGLKDFQVKGIRTDIELGRVADQTCLPAQREKEKRSSDCNVGAWPATWIGLSLVITGLEASFVWNRHQFRFENQAAPLAISPRIFVIVMFRNRASRSGSLRADATTTTHS
jgi:hypothetical protein